MPQRTSQSVRVIPFPDHTEREAEAVPHWCIRVFLGVGGGNTYVAGFTDKPYPFISVVAEPEDVASADDQQNAEDMRDAIDSMDEWFWPDNRTGEPCEDQFWRDSFHAINGGFGE